MSQISQLCNIVRCIIGAAPTPSRRRQQGMNDDALLRQSLPLDGGRSVAHQFSFQRRADLIKPLEEARKRPVPRGAGRCVFEATVEMLRRV
jgi:hypothetical protein